MSEKKGCWNCEFQQIGGGSFLGIRAYFGSIGKENEDIPRSLVDKECQFWFEK